MAPTSVAPERKTQKMNRTLPFLLLAGLIAPSATAQEGLADQLPGETAIYFEIPDLNQFSEGFAGSTLGRIWNDAPMQEFLAPVMPMIQGGLAQAKMGLEAQGIPGALLDPASYGRIEVGVAFGGFDPMVGPDITAGAKLSFHDAALAESCYGLLGGMMAGMGAEMTESGIHFSDGTAAIDVVLQGSTLTLKVQKGAAMSGTLTGASNFGAARAALQGGQMFIHIDIARLMDLLYGVLADEGPAELQAMLPMIASSVGLDSIGSMSFTPGWKGGESFGDGIISFGPEGAGGLIGVGLSGNLNANTALAEYVPANATSFSIGTADFASIWSFVTGTADQLLGMAEAQGEAIDRNAPEFAWLYGEDRAAYDKAFGAIGPDAFSWSKDEFSMTGGGGSGGSFVQIQDVEAVRAMFGNVMPQLQGMLDEVDAVDLLVKNATDRKKDAEGNWTTVKLGEYYQLRLNLSALPIPDELQMQLSMAASAIPQPAFGVTDDGWLVFSMNGSSGVRKAMKAQSPRHPWPEAPPPADPTLRAPPRGR
mgnify:CR=1 FL=1